MSVQPVSVATQATMGAMWGVSLVMSGSFFAVSLLNKPKGFEGGKKLFSNAIGFFGTSVNAFAWMRSVSWISFEDIAFKYLRAIGYNASLIVSVIGMGQDVADFQEANRLIEKGLTEKERTLGWHRKKIAILSLISRITSIVWATLGLVSLFVAGISLGLIGFLAFASFVFALTTLVYRIWLECSQRKALSRAHASPAV